MATVLISACPQDPSTRYGYYYLKKASAILAKHGHKVIILRTATLSNFQKTLVKYDPDLVILNGHGGSKGVTGCGINVLLGVCSWDAELGVKIERENPEWMRGRLVYLFTCNAGKELAHRLLFSGAVAVAAYREPFIFLAENETGVDSDAYPFFDAALKLPIMLAGGFTFGEGVQALREAFQKYQAAAEERGDELEAKYLNWDRLNLVTFGDMNATLES